MTTLFRRVLVSDEPQAHQGSKRKNAGTYNGAPLQGAWIWEFVEDDANNHYPLRGMNSDAEGGFWFDGVPLKEPSSSKRVTGYARRGGGCSWGSTVSTSINLASGGKK